MKAIVPRKVVNHGLERWRIIVPKDLRPREGRAFLFFEDAQKAGDKAKELQRNRDKIGAGFLRLSQQQQALVLEALDRVQGDAQRLLMAVDKLSEAEKNAQPRLVTTVVDECLASKKAAGLRDRSLKSLRSTLLRFGASSSALVKDEMPMIGKITAALIEEWLQAGNEKTKTQWSAPTRKGYLTDLRTLFSFALKRGYVSSNPALAVDKPMLEEKPPGIHTVEQAKRLLAAVLQHDPGLIGYICPIYFGGLRPEECRRLAKAQILMDVIEISGPKAKKRQRRFVPINDTLRAWLSIKKTQIGPKNLVRRLRRIRQMLATKNAKGEIINFDWPPDVLRHSFCSYSLPKNGASKTAEWAGHSEQILFAHYRERVLPADVEQFWALTPANVGC